MQVCPNPFSPFRYEYVRFRFGVAEAAEVQIDTLNFAMETVGRGGAPAANNLGRFLFRDAGARMVDNRGISSVRLGKRISRGKIVVINGIPVNGRQSRNRPFCKLGLMPAPCPG